MHLENTREHLTLVTTNAFDLKSAMMTVSLKVDSLFQGFCAQKSRWTWLKWSVYEKMDNVKLKMSD